MESFEKRKRERRKQELRKEKAARKLQGLEPSGPSQEDYFADPGAPDAIGAIGEEPDATAAPAHSEGQDAASAKPATASNQLDPTISVWRARADAAMQPGRSARDERAPRIAAASHAAPLK